MTHKELLARLTVAPGDFVTLTAEEAAQVREIMQRRIPITVDVHNGAPLPNPEEFSRPEPAFRMDVR